MKPDHDQQLEAAINAELRPLPEMVAPAALSDRVMRAIEQRARLPWYRRSWQTWPVAWQASSFALLLALFGGLCLGSWELPQTHTPALALHRVGEWLSGLHMIGNTLDVLSRAALLVVKKLGAGVVAACLISMALGYALCVGLGTVYFRLAFEKPKERSL
ncbi:MAG TPA: hypothetical protein VMB80_01310 [Candidatus Acidoferrum sp.]|nr:hypothetical protein [Candidatus Acidoferrum sp.]